MSSISERELTHEKLGADFDVVMNPYDIKRRLDILIGFLAEFSLEGALILDAGCGTGRGAEKLVEHGAIVTAVDLGYQLLTRTQERCECDVAQASILTLPFADATFDMVFSTEVIEHTPNPSLGVQEMVRVLKPNGLLSLSTPNLLWQTPVRLASKLGLRPYDGLENFVGTKELRNILLALNGELIHHRGIHILPFQLTPLRPILRYFDRFGHILLPLMINQAVLYRKGL